MRLLSAIDVITRLQISNLNLEDIYKKIYIYIQNKIPYKGTLTVSLKTKIFTYKLFTYKLYKKVDIK